MLDQRVRDGVIRRMIDKWLKAGVLELGNLRFSELGTPQGGVVSPLIANVYLHEVLDAWFERDVKQRLRGAARLFRYADDLVFVFEREDDARRVFNVLPKRFGKYGLTLHPDKTRLMRFHRPRSPDDTKQARRPGTFDLLGFTHYWGKSYRGGLVLKRKTMRGRLSRAVKAITVWCKRHRHLPVAEQHATLNRKLMGLRILRYHRQ